MTTLSLIEQILIPVVVLTLLAGGIAGVALGIGLVFRAECTLAFIARMNRWVSTRRALKPLEIPRSVEPAPSVRHPLFGAFLVLGGAVVVYVLALRLQLPRVSIAGGPGPVLWAIAVDTIRWILVAGSAAGLLLGALMLFAPARYAAVTARLNYWYSTRKLIPAGSDAMRVALEPKVEGNPRLAGWLIAGASLAVTLAMVTLLFTRMR
jgi:hypothetical protein